MAKWDYKGVQGQWMSQRCTGKLIYSLVWFYSLVAFILTLLQTTLNSNIPNYRFEIEIERVVSNSSYDWGVFIYSFRYLFLPTVFRLQNLWRWSWWTCKNQKPFGLFYNNPKPMEKSYSIFVEGSRVILTSGLAYKNVPFLQHLCFPELVWTGRHLCLQKPLKTTASFLDLAKMCQLMFSIF